MQRRKLRRGICDVISSGQDMTCIAVICLKQEEQSIEEALRSRGFSRIAQSSAKTPAGETEELKQAIKEKENSDFTNRAGSDQARRTKRRDLSACSYYRVRAEKYEVLGEIPQIGKYFCAERLCSSSGCRKGETGSGK